MNELRELIESEIRRPSVFIDESVLYPEFIPPVIRYRDKQLKQLVELFKPVILKPGAGSVKVLLAGPVGTGKTLTSIVFGREISRVAESRSIKLRYVHVNCSKSRNLVGIIREAKDSLYLHIPDRGVSSNELLSAFLKLLSRENMYLILALDEFEYFLNTAPPEDRHAIIRMYDILQEEVKRVNMIFIVRGSPANVWSRVDSVTGSYLMKNFIPFEPYRALELYTILKDRVDAAFHQGVVGDEVLDYISKMSGYDTGGDGNARKALAVLHAAGKLADKDLADGRATRVTIDHVRQVVAQEYPALIDLLDSLHYLSLHEILVLKAVLLAMRESGLDYVPMSLIETTYSKVCEEIGEKPRKHTQIYTYLTDLRQRGIIITKTSLKGRRGRSTYVGFGAAPLGAALQKLDTVIKQLRVG
ncbi:MAG: ORC1-type DNA replication protein [Thermoprotei archaeon]